MAIDHLLNWLPLLCWLVMLAERWVRVIAYRRRGVQVIINDLRRPIRQLLFDLVILMLFLLWFYFVVAEAVPLPLDWWPPSLMTRITNSLTVRLAGCMLVISGAILYEIALQQMGDSWRIGIDTKRPSALVTSGLFAWLRNPIYAAFDLIFIGTFLVFGRIVYLLLAIALIICIHRIVLREERFLTGEFGDAFVDYRNRVRRYGVL